MIIILYKFSEFETRQLIRAFHLRDAHRVTRLQRAGMPLDLEEQLTHPRSPLRSVFLDTVLSPRSGPTTFILNQKDESGKEILGLAQVRLRPGRPERDVVFLSPRLDNGSGSHATWQRLLTHLAVKTAEAGSLRLYARLPLDSEESQIFKNVGFVAYGQEEIYQLDQSAGRKSSAPALNLRPQQAGDSWGMQKLYATLTPRAVQNTEGLAQGQWELTPRRRWGEQGRRLGFVWEDDGEILAALHVRAGKNGYWLRTLLHPDARDQADALCHAALQFTTDRPHLPVYFAFRQYESGWQHILPALNYIPLTSQLLLVKPLTVRIRDKTPAILPGMDASHTEGAASITLSPAAGATLKNGSVQHHTQILSDS